MLAVPWLLLLVWNFKELGGVTARRGAMGSWLLGGGASEESAVGV